MLKCRFMEQLVSTILKSTHGARSSKNIGRVFFPFQPVVNIHFRGIRSTYITHIGRKCDILPFVLLLFMMRIFLHRWINIFIYIRSFRFRWFDSMIKNPTVFVLFFWTHFFENPLFYFCKQIVFFLVLYKIKLFSFLLKIDRFF